MKRDVEGKMSSLGKKMNQLSTDRGKLESEVNSNSQKINERREIVQKIAMEQNIDLGHVKDNILDAQVDRFVENLNQIAKNFTKTLSEMKTDFDRKENDLQAEMNEILRKKSAFEQTALMKKADILKNENEIKSLKINLTKIDASQSRLTFLEQEILKKEKSSADAAKAVDEDSLKKEISTFTAEKLSVDSNLAKLRSELKEAQSTNELRIKLDNLNADKATKEKQLEKYLDTHKDSLEQFFPKVLIENLRDAVERYASKKTSEVVENEKILQEKNVKSKEFEVKRKHIQNQIDQKAKELEAFDENILQTSGGDENFDEQLRAVSKNLDELHIRKGTIDGAHYLYKNYIEKLERNPCCPLCRRDFSTENESKILLNELSGRLNNLPTEQKQLQANIKEKESKQQELIKLQPTVELAQKIRLVELPSLKKEKESITNEFRSVQSEINQSKEKLDKLKEEEKNVTKIVSDVSLIDSLNIEITDFKRRIDDLDRKINSGTPGSNRSLSQIQDEVNDLEQTRDNLTRDVERKQEKLHLFRDRMQKLNVELNNLKKEENEINQNMQKRLSIKSSIDKLSSDMDVYREEADKADRQAKPLDEILNDAKKKRIDLSKEFNCGKEEIEKKSISIDRQRESIQILTKSIKKFESEGKAKLLSSCLTDIQSIDKDIARKSNELTSIDQKLANLDADLIGQDAKRRDLQDNLDVRRKEIECRTYESRLDELSKKILRLESTGLGGDAKKFHQNYLDLKSKCDKLDGILEELLNSRKSLKADLETDRYKRANERYRDKFIDIKATEIAVEDVKKYAMAVDFALLKYHESKMKKINDNIKDLWQQVYKGGDIDYIQVKAEADSQASSDKRRAYNYRVVMYVNNHELDMRGRCSAGQKVLASILIRIALAEVFCTNCGVLALDEPTTNLDSNNIQSLAEALAQIIDRRSMQKNFQLILITHDQDFVRLLLQQHPVDFYYKVSKDENGFSQLRRDSAMSILSQ